MKISGDDPYLGIIDVVQYTLDIFQKEQFLHTYRASWFDR
jgi:hypothetical protein